MATKPRSYTELIRAKEMVSYAVTTGTTTPTDAEKAEARAWYPLVSVTAGGAAAESGGVTASLSALCPDLLRFEQLGEADGWRGRVVRAFFFVMRGWPPR